MKLLPDDVAIQDIRQFLTTVLEENMIVKRKIHVLQGLQLAEHLQVHQILGVPNFDINNRFRGQESKNRLHFL